MKTEKTTDLVLVGGGHAHVQVLRRFGMEPPPDTHLTLVVDTPIAIYSGMVPGYVAGQYRREELEIDVVPLARRAGARVILARAERIDAEQKRVHLEGRAPIRYDLASLDIGSTVAGLDLPGVREHALPTRPISELVKRTDSLVERIATRPAGTAFRIVVVGGGAGGVELAFTLWHRAGGHRAPGIEVTLVHAWPDVLAGYPPSLAARVHRNAATRRIRIVPDRRVVEVREHAILFDDGETIPYDALIWVAGAASHSLLRSSGLPTESRGFVRTRSTLQVEGYDALFAVGDCATLTEFPKTPKAGVYAVRQGPYLIENLLAAIDGRPLRAYRPQSDFLTLLNLGDGSALGAKWGRSFEGEWVMRLKDGIDRRFMKKFQVLDPRDRLTEEFRKLPDMSSRMEILCGGCAAKVGESVLNRALSRLGPRAPDASVKLGLDERDDAAAFETPRGDLVVSSIDGFRAFVDDPYLVGRIAAVNSLSDLQAKGAKPRYALAFVAIPKDAGDEEAEETLFQVLSGARAVFDEGGVTLLGGHTTTAPELLVGFSVDGFATGTALLAIDKLEPGDRLLLTKRLGTGVLLHADMLGRAPGRALQECFASMLETNEQAAAIAVELGAKAMTDVTGFGLVGHLGAMLRASGASGVVGVDALSALPGVVSLLGQGFRSTSHPENAKARKALVVGPGVADDPRFELLFDPQTSGGLLFGLPPSRVEEALARFHRVAVLGEVLPPRADGALIEVRARFTASDLASTEARAPLDAPGSRHPRG
jgi:selenide, water dikinase